MEEWDVCASDEEWSVYNPPEAKNVDSLFIPDRLACLFNKIQEDGVLPITTGYPRAGNNNNNNNSNNKDVTQSNNNNNNNNSITASNTTPPPSQEGMDPQTPGSVTTTTTAPDAEGGGGVEEGGLDDKNKSMEAFNFEEADGDKPSLKRKTTPGSGAKQRGKKEKVGSMTNVMSDLLRHKYLDELESKKDEAVPPQPPPPPPPSTAAPVATTTPDNNIPAT